MGLPKELGGKWVFGRWRKFPSSSFSHILLPPILIANSLSYILAQGHPRISETEVYRQLHPVSDMRDDFASRYHQADGF
jgi:hypothetical protein